MRITRAIVVYQKAFFKDGPKYLAPLTQKDIAEELDISESTVSRTANSKYVQTEWGIFELKYFFTNSIKWGSAEKSGFSKGGVKEILREILCAEGKNCSDMEITQILAKQGISIARRTVAKYRNELDLASSYRR